MMCCYIFPGRSISTEAAAVLATQQNIDVLGSSMSYLDTGWVPRTDDTLLHITLHATRAVKQCLAIYLQVYQVKRQQC